MTGENSEIRRERPSRGLDDIKSAVDAPSSDYDNLADERTSGYPPGTKDFNETKQGWPVSSDDISAPEAPSPGDEPGEGYGDYTAMQPSMLGQELLPEQDQGMTGGYTAQPPGVEMGAATYPPGMDSISGFGGYAADAYQQYQPYQEAMSSDVITEISEQVVAEKLSAMQDKLEKALDFRTVAEARITSLNERLRRIEGILDRLQLSILQKVGDYVNDVRDIKQELLETQQSFKAIAPTLKKYSKVGPSKKGKSSEIVP